jgi:hypothetical protein
MYTYENPLKKGYKKVNLSNQEYNQLFPVQIHNRCDSREYYIRDSDFLIHHFSSNYFIIISVLLYPVNLLSVGFRQFKELNNDFKKLLNQKEYGYFSEDIIFGYTDKYTEIVDKLNNGE